MHNYSFRLIKFFLKCYGVSFFCVLEPLITETEAWFIDSFEEWRKAKNLSNFILLGHSFGGYVAAKYALQVNSFSYCTYEL